MIFLIILLILISVIILGLLVYYLLPLKYPIITESDYSYANHPWWELHYLHKYLHPRKRAEKNSGLEKYFHNMTFNFDKTELKNPQTISIKAVGDLMFRRDLKDKGGEHLWDEIGDYLFNADLKIANLEFAINPNQVIEKTVQFSIPPEYTKHILGKSKSERFDIVSLANNHINDSLKDGIISTCDYLDSIGIKHVGANRNKKEQDNFPILEKNGIKIAILSYTFSTNGILLEQDFGFGTNVIRFNAIKDEDYDPSLIHRHIKIAREKGAEYIISCNHWGMDLEYYPPARVVKRAKDLCEAGIDLIIGHHPHVINPVEHYKTKDKRDCLIFYSLGNLTTRSLIFANFKLSEIAEIILEKGETENGKLKVRPKKIVITPVMHSINKIDGEFHNRILFVNDGMKKIENGNIPEYYTKKDIRRIKYLYKEFNKYFKNDNIDDYK